MKNDYNYGTIDSEKVMDLVSPPVWSLDLINWYRRCKRDLPWRRTKDPYAIWVSEIMLQQTRVEAVKGYYSRFLERFPNIEALATANEAEVLKLWEGLGYYSRARNLQKAAKLIEDEYEGAMPVNYDELLHLPGIGDYTAGAIASIAHGEAVPAIDGNVKRVTARIFGIRESVDRPDIIKQIRKLLQNAIPQDHPADFNQAMMELGATVCVPRMPKCDLCPIQSFCDGYTQGDADSLPIHEKKAPGKTVDMAVILLTWENQVCVFKRQERLLHGMYVFSLLEDETDPQQIASMYKQDGIYAEYKADLGNATHVFTHRIWKMKIFHFALQSMPDQQWLNKRQGVMATTEMLESLPIPAAMKAARKEAMKLMAE